MGALASRLSIRLKTIWNKILVFSSIFFDLIFFFTLFIFVSGSEFDLSLKKQEMLKGIFLIRFTRKKEFLNIDIM